MTKKELIGQKAYYLNPKNLSTIKNIKRIDTDKIIVELDNGIVADFKLIYLDNNKKEIAEILDEKI